MHGSWDQAQTMAMATVATTMPTTASQLMLRWRSLEASQKGSARTASSVVRKGTWPRTARQQAAATTTMAAAVEAEAEAAVERAKAEVASKAIATSVASQATCHAIAFLTRNRLNSRGRKKKLLEHQWRY